jgi:predicted Zn-dependent protease
MKHTLKLLSGSALLIALGCTVHAFDFGLDKITRGLEKAEAIATDGSRVLKGLAGIGIEEERTIGGSVAVEVVSRYGGLVRDENVISRLNLIGKTLAGYSDRPGLTWRFGLLDSEQINAFSAPGGYVFITRGLYEMCDDDDHLAAVLAHEIAHITQRHALKIVRRAEFFTGASNIVSRQSSDYRAIESSLNQFDLGIKQIVTTLCEQGFDPNTEYDADARGDALCTLAGYKPGSLHAALKSVQASGVEKERVFSTHPPIKDRLRRLPSQ